MPSPNKCRRQLMWPTQIGVGAGGYRTTSAGSGQEGAGWASMVVDWEDICDAPPPQLKISPISMIPHKSQSHRTILDLSFSIWFQYGIRVPLINKSSIKLAPWGAIHQFGHSLSRIIPAFASTTSNAKVFMTKWDIKDGFWRLDCEEGKEWNFAYVQPNSEGNSIQLVIPNSLQIGWIKSLP